MREQEWKNSEGEIYFDQKGENRPFYVGMELKDSVAADHIWNIKGCRIAYNAQSGILWCGENKYQIGIGHRKVLMLVDDTLLELFFDGGEKACAVTLPSGTGAFSADGNGMKDIKIATIS